MNDLASGASLLLSERIRIALADDITAGLLAPGLTLDEQQVGNRFGASRTPVREAFRQLASSGLIKSGGFNSGAINDPAYRPRSSTPTKWA